MRQFPHAGHERGFSRALHQSDFGSPTATAIAIALLKSTPDLLFVLAGGRHGARNIPLRDTPLPDRAHGTARLVRYAHGCAEFHHRLIEVPWPGIGEKRLRMLPDLRRSQIDAGKSLQHTLDIAIDNGYGPIKRDAGDGGSSVASDAGQGEQGFGILRKAPAVLYGDLLRALVQHARAPIVAEAAPGGQHVIRRSCGERLDIRKTVEEYPVVVEDGGHARLLQHDFAEPDAIGIASFAPGKVAAMLIVPAEKSAAKSG